LHDEGDYIAEIAIFDVERGDPEAWPRLTRKAIRMKKARCISASPAKIDTRHHHDKDGEANQKVDE